LKSTVCPSGEGTGAESVTGENSLTDPFRRVSTLRSVPSDLIETIRPPFTRKISALSAGGGVSARESAVWTIATANASDSAAAKSAVSDVDHRLWWFSLPPDVDILRLIFLLLPDPIRLPE
jgi:hypothetical protein